MKRQLVVIPGIEDMILTFRGHRVMVDADLAGLYGVETRVLNQAVKRNSSRFPEHFMFELAPEERRELITKCDRFLSLRHSTVLPKVFYRFQGQADASPPSRRSSPAMIL